jgi:tellurite resistance protein TehA-like permease
MAIFSSVVMVQNMPTHAEAAPEVSILSILFPVLALLQAGFGLFGLWSGIHFLKLEPWSRTALEVLTWVLLVFVVAFGIFWLFMWIWMARNAPSLAFTVMGAVMGTCITALYAVPLGIMLKYLRGEKVRNAMIGPIELGGDVEDADIEDADTMA